MAEGLAHESPLARQLQLGTEQESGFPSNGAAVNLHKSFGCSHSGVTWVAGMVAAWRLFTCRSNAKRGGPHQIHRPTA